MRPQIITLLTLIFTFVISMLASAVAPVLTIDNVEGNHDILTINYTIVAPSGIFVTTNWQFSTDGGETWLDINAIAIGNNDPKPAGSSFITWDTQAGANNLADKYHSSVYFRMFVKEGDVWKTKSPMPTARERLAAGVIDGKIYAVGGVSNSTSYSNKLECYDPTTDSWTTLANMPTGRQLLEAGVIDGKLYAVGGNGGDGKALITVEKYNPSTNSWTTVASMLTARSELAIVAIDGKIYATGGNDSVHLLNTLEEYTPPRASKIATSDSFAVANHIKAVIASPTDGAFLSNVVNVTGIAMVTEASLDHWILDFAQGEHPDVGYTPITISTDPVEDVLLGTWDTTVQDDGLYTLRLHVTDTNEIMVETAVVVTLDNGQPTLVCKTDQSIYNRWEKVQVLTDVDNPGDSFGAQLLGGIIVIRTPPQKHLILTGEVVTKTIAPGLNLNIPLYVSGTVITGIVAPEGTHGSFCVLYAGDSILAIDTSRWGVTNPPALYQEKFFSDFILSYIKRYGIKSLINANDDIPLPSTVSNVPLKKALGNAFPSVANPETWLPFQLSEPSKVTIKIHNPSGQLVRTLELGHKPSGFYFSKAKAAYWDGKDNFGQSVASGLYFYTLQAGEFRATRKMVILK